MKGHTLTQVTTRTEVPDDPREREGVGGGYYYFIAHCYCGWSSDEDERRPAAVEAHVFHVEEQYEAAHPEAAAR